MFDNITPIQAIVSLVLSSKPDSLKEKVVSFSLKVLSESPEKSIINSIYSIFLQSGGWPSIDTCISLGCTSSLLDFNSVNFDVADLFHVISNFTLRQQKLSISRELLSISNEIPNLSLSDILNRLSSINSSVGVKSTVRKRLSGKDSYKKQESMPVGSLTFISQIDDRIGSVVKGSTCTIGGYVGQFKTSVGLHILYSNAVYAKQNCVYISLEQPHNILNYYLLSRHSFHDCWSGKNQPVDKSKIIKTTMSEEEKSFVFDTVEPDLYSSGKFGHIHILDRSDFTDLSPTNIKIKLAEIEESDGEPIDLIVVDYMQKFRFVPEGRVMCPGGSSYDVANSYVVFFQSLAMDFNNHPMSVTLLAQTSREGYEKAVESEGAYDVPALAELSSLDKESAVIIFLFATDDLKDSGEIKINLAKNRYGDTFINPIITRIDPKFTIVGDGPGSSLEPKTDFSSLLFGGSFSTDFKL